MQRIYKVLMCGLFCVFFAVTTSMAAGLFQKHAGPVVLLGEVQSYGDNELKATALDTFADKLNDRLQQQNVSVINRGNVTNESGRHDQLATSEDALLSQIHMDAIVHGHQFEYGYAAAKLKQYADAHVGRSHFYDEEAVKAWHKEEEKTYKLSQDLLEPVRQVAAKYGASQLLFVNIKDVDVRLKGTVFATRTERETRGKKMKSRLDYYLVDTQSGTVYEGHCENKKSAQLLNFLLVKSGKGMNVDEMLHSLIDVQTEEVAADIARKGMKAVRSVQPVRTAAAKPVVMLAGFESRVTASPVTLTTLPMDQRQLLTAFADTLAAELANDGRYDFYDTDATTTQARLDEYTLVRQLGQGAVAPALQAKADYILYGYLTDLSEVKAQTALVGIGGRNKTIRVGVSLRVMDAHTGAIVYAATADSRRKSELVYHAIAQRHDAGQEDAVSQALSIAAQNLANQFKEAM